MNDTPNSPQFPYAERPLVRLTYQGGAMNGSQSNQAQENAMPHFQNDNPQVHRADPRNRMRYRSGQPTWSRMLPKIVVGTAFVGLVGLGWYAYEKAPKMEMNGEPPMITADAEPYREAPADPGGMQVPNQDKLVYEELTGGKQAEERMETAMDSARVLPGPEEPVARPTPTDAEMLRAEGERLSHIVTAAGGQPADQAAPVRVESGAPAVAAAPVASDAAPSPAADASAAPETPMASAPSPVPTTLPASDKTKAEAEVKSEKTIETAASKKNTATHVEIALPKVHEEPKTETKTAPKTITIAKLETVPQTKAPATKTAAKDAAKTTAQTTAKWAGGGWRVQLAAFRSKEEAERQWSTMARKHTGLLSGMIPAVQKANIEGKGTYYRLQTGPFASNAVAQKLCRNLQSAGQGCFVVK